MTRRLNAVKKKKNIIGRLRTIWDCEKIFKSKICTRDINYDTHIIRDKKKNNYAVPHELSAVCCLIRTSVVHFRIQAGQRER